MRSPFRRSVLLFLAVAFVPLFAGAVFTVAVDPYGHLGMPEIEGFNQQKPHRRVTEREMVAARLAAGGAETVYLGTSRAGAGLSESHPAMVRALNAGVPGANAHDLLRFFQHATATNPVKRVVIGADFFTFNAYYQKSDGFHEDLFAVDADGSPVSPALRQVRTRIRALAESFTWTAMKAAVETLAAQGKNRDAGRQPPRMGTLVSDAEEQLKQIRYQEDSFLSEFWFPKPQNGYSHVYPGTRRTTLEKFDRIAAESRRRGIELIVFFSPIHARLSFALDNAGLWPAYESWKRETVAIVARRGAQPGTGSLSIWDFSAAHAITTEPVPSGPGAPTMTWYSETSHYEPATGNLVLDRVTGWREMPPFARDFGRRLAPETMDGHLAELRAGLARWAAENPRDAAEIEAAARRRNRCCRSW